MSRNRPSRRLSHGTRLGDVPRDRAGNASIGTDGTHGTDGTRLGAACTGEDDDGNEAGDTSGSISALQLKELRREQERQKANGVEHCSTSTWGDLLRPVGRSN